MANKPTKSAPGPRARVGNHLLWYELRDLPPIIEKVRPFTMVPHESLVDLARQVCTVVTHEISGALVECGTWRGGAAFLMAGVLQQSGVHERKVWLFDSFEGIPPPQEIDGAAAKAWAEDKSGPLYFDNLRAPVEGVRQAAADLGLSYCTEIVKGWFDQTLPAMRDRIGPIAILRIDADWYASVKCCLEHLYDLVVEDGFIIFDDYYTFDGCAIAVHEFLGRRGLAHRIESIGSGPEFSAAVFRKGDLAWRWSHQEYLLIQQIAELVGSGKQFILVDEETFRPFLTAAYDVLPFPEHEGMYWGKPDDDAAAIAEFERLRQNGAHLIVFAWPSFWWLNHYRDFARLLRTCYRCVVENDLAVAFDLRSEQNA